VTTGSSETAQYDGFLSYATTSDYENGRRVEAFLESFHKLTPPEGAAIGRLQICRDGSDFRLPKVARGPSDSDPIWAIIVSQLESAKYLLVLCSPGAVASPWVAKEISWFIERRGANRVLPLLTAGRDPIHSPEECFPAGLIAAGIYSARIWYDLRGYRSSAVDQRVRDYEDEMVRLVSDLLEWDSQTFGPLSTLWQREQLRIRRRRATIATGVAAVVILLASLTTWWALQARHEALRARVASFISVANSQKDATTSALVLNEAAALTGSTAPAGAAALAAHLVATKRALTVLRGHQGAVVSVVFNPEGDTLLTASQDGTARIWRAEAGGQPIVLTGSGDGLVDAAFSHDGRRIVTAGSNGIARIWSSDGTKQPIELKGHTQALRSANFSSDDTRVVTASDDGVARVWRVEDGSLIAALRGHSDSVRSAVFSRNGDRVLTASDDGTARLWAIDGTSQPKIFGFPGHAQFWSAAFSPDEKKIVVASSEGTGWLFSPTDEFPFITLVQGYGSAPISSAVFSPDGKWIATGSQNGMVYVWNIKRLSALGRTNLSDLTLDAGSLVKKVIFSGDSRRVVAVSQDGAARVWSVDGDSDPLVFGYHDGPVLDAALSPDGARLATASSDSTIRIWSAAPATEPIVADVHHGPISRVQFDSAADRALTATKDGTLWFWRAEGVGYVEIDHLDTPVRYASLNVRGTYAAVVTEDRSITVFDTNSRRPPPVIAASGSTFRLASVNGDASALVTVSGENLVQLWRRSREEAASALNGHEGVVNSARFSADGQRIVTTGEDQTVRVWRTDGAGEPTVFRGHQSAVTDAWFSPDGRFVVSVSVDTTARVWDLAGRLQPRILGGHRGPVFSAAFSDDGTKVVTGSLDEARVWSLDTLDLPVTLNVPGGKVSAVAFTHDGGKVATATDDGRLWIWHVEERWLLDQIRSQTRACLSADQRIRLLGETPPSAASAYQNCVVSLDRR
jgi:WD40 repeat protein